MNEMQKQPSMSNDKHSEVLEHSGGESSLLNRAVKGAAICEHDNFVWSSMESDFMKAENKPMFQRNDSVHLWLNSGQVEEWSFNNDYFNDDI